METPRLELSCAERASGVPCGTPTFTDFYQPMTNHCFGHVPPVPASGHQPEVDKNGMGGMPGEVSFEADSLQAGTTTVKLHGGATKEVQDKVGKAIGLMFIPGAPMGVFVHGKDAEIKPGAAFTAFVDADTLLPLAN